MRQGCLGAVGLLAALLMAVFVGSTRPGRITRTNSERIRADMTLTQVEPILGGPGVEVSESDLGWVVDFSKVPAGQPGWLRLVPRSDAARAV